MPAGPQDHPDEEQIQEIAERTSLYHGARVLKAPVGESMFDRESWAISAAQTTQQLRLSGFTALATQNISRVRMVGGTQAAAATPTLVRIGVYEADVAGNLTLVASTPNDTTLFAAASTTYTKAFSEPFLKVAGRDYMVGILVVSAVAFPTFIGPITGVSVAFSTDVMAMLPRVGGLVAAQADLPTSVATGSITNSGLLFHALLLQ